MSMFPLVSKGDPFVPQADFFNACRLLLNTFSPSGNPASLYESFMQTKVPCYNNTKSKLKAGSSVCIDDNSSVMLNSVMPVKICDKDDKLWGVLDYDLEPTCCGSFTVLGVARVNYSGDCQYLQPDFNGGYQESNSGSAIVLCSLGNDEKLILLSHGAAGRYNGPFAFSIEDRKLKVSAGFLNRNGKMMRVPEKTLLVSQSGYVCVTSRFDTESNTWKEPTIEMTDPAADAYPIGYCSTNDHGFTLQYECYEVPVAIIVYTKECPLAAKYNE